MKTVTIDGEEFVKKSDIRQSDKPTSLQIIILQRGWVIIGRYREEKDEFVCEDSKSYFTGFNWRKNNFTI